jgi:plastocyanin
MEKKINIVALILKVMLITTVVIMAGCTKSNNPVYTSTNSGGSPGANEVWMQGIAFVPASKTISVGTTITWTNKDNTTHIVTSGIPNYPDGIFKSGSMNNGDTYSFKFNTAGTFKYYCFIHGAMMTATMIVQ